MWQRLSNHQKVFGVIFDEDVRTLRNLLENQIVNNFYI